MNVVIDRPQARWLPSRHHFALARLLAFVQLRWSKGAGSPTPEHLILSIDRDQSAAEHYCAAMWTVLTTASYIAVLLPLRMPFAFFIAVPLAFFAIHIPVVGGGLILRLLAGDENHVTFVSVGAMGMLFLWSAYVARTALWARFVAWFFFAVVATNAVSWLLLRLLRAQVRTAEERCVL
ncbi:MAG: hypothetical protein QOK37_4806 [Thermoanaerobaculia bacterium]|jgi:hypothetical protein|nr:hypothetical protein [Thermoanaerobaculia bacterium]